MNNDDNNEQKAIVPIGPNGLEFRDIDSLFRFAKAVELSGLAPKGLEKKEAIFIALCMAVELRMSPMAALQNIAVINGRPGIFGDAALALVRASGVCESYSQELTGEGDSRKAIVRSSRAGVEIVSEFSVADAKRAQLWAKSGPWSQYPDRMLIFRARGFNLRDNFGDVLKGFRTTEELADIPEERHVAGHVVEPNLSNGGRRTRAPRAEVVGSTPPHLVSTGQTPEPFASASNETTEPTDPEPDPAAVITARLKEAGIHQEAFLNLLVGLGLIDVDTADISAGYFVLGHVDKRTLQIALADWDRVTKTLKGAVSA
jgi:hypothetical protein